MLPDDGMQDTGFGGTRLAGCAVHARSGSQRHAVPRGR